MSNRTLVTGPRRWLVHHMPLFIVALSVLLMLTMAVAVTMGAICIPLDLVWGVVASHIAPGSVPVTWSPGRHNIVAAVATPRAGRVDVGALRRPVAGVPSQSDRAGLRRWRAGVLSCGWALCAVVPTLPRQGRSRRGKLDPVRRS